MYIFLFLLIHIIYLTSPHNYQSQGYGKNYFKHIKIFCEIFNVIFQAVNGVKNTPKTTVITHVRKK